MDRVVRASLLILVLLLLLRVLPEGAYAMIPVEVYGYVYMPNGTPAIGAQVEVAGGGDVRVTTTNEKGFYEVTLTVASVPVRVTVKAFAPGYAGMGEAEGEGVIRVDVYLSEQGGTVFPASGGFRVNISLDRQEYYIGERAVIQGVVEPSMATNVTLSIVTPRGTIIEVTVRSDESGFFEHSIEVNEVGTWTIYARAYDPMGHREAKSRVLSFEAKMRLYLEIYGESVGVGRVKVQGKVLPPLGGIPVVILASFDNGRTWLPIANTTTREGYYEVEIELTVAGRVLFKAYIPPTETMAGVESEGFCEVVVSTQEEERLKLEVKELRERVTMLTQEIETIRSEIEFYRQIALIGIPLSLLLGIALAYYLLRKMGKT